MATASASAHEETEGTTASGDISPQHLQVIHQATKKFRTPAVAEAAGFVAIDARVELPGLGGMDSTR